MAGPTIPNSGIKRSASEQFEEPPYKRADVAADIDQDRGYGRDRDRERFSFERVLVPMISRAETAQYQGYIKELSYTRGTGNEGDESDDEFVDAQEAVTEGAIIPQIEETPGEQPNLNGKIVAVKEEAGRCPTEGSKEQIVANGNQVLGFPVKKVNGTSKTNDLKEEPAERQTKKDSKAQKFKPEPETISLDSDSEDGDAVRTDNKMETGDENYGARDEDEKMSGMEGDEPRQEEEDAMSIDDNNDVQQEEPEFEDMFAATFGEGKNKTKVRPSIEEPGDNASSFSGGPGKAFASGVHETTIRNGNSDEHPSTPPSSTPALPSSTTPAAIATTHPAPPPRRRPDIKRDLSNLLVKHERFHTKAMLLIPRLPNHETLDWTRRYWIAVLIEGKRPRNNMCEKDFVWMKGNRFSTVATVFHSYALAVMADPDDLALLLGQESVEMTDQMQELDYFNDRFVVFRAVKLEGNEEAKGRSLVPNIIPASETISLDID